MYTFRRHSQKKDPTSEVESGRKPTHTPEGRDQGTPRRRAAGGTKDGSQHHSINQTTATLPWVTPDITTASRRGDSGESDGMIAPH